MNIATKTLTRLLQFVNRRLRERRQPRHNSKYDLKFLEDFRSQHTSDGQLRPRTSSEGARSQQEGKPHEGECGCGFQPRWLDNTKGK